MLKHIQKFYFLRFSANFSSTKEIYSQISSRRTSKRQENKRLIENVFFPEYSLASQRSELENILSTKPEDQKYLTESEYHKLLTHKSPLPKKEELLKKNDSKQFSEIKRHREIFVMLSRNRVNEKMLNIYMKFEKLFGRSEIDFLMKRLEWSLKNETEIKIQEKDEFMKKQENLKRIHENVELKFTSVFLTKQGIFEHPGWNLMIKNTEDKIKQRLYTNRDGILICRSILLFMQNGFPSNLLSILRKV